MARRLLAAALLALCLLLPSAAMADTRALLVACSDFLTQPELGSAVSGNLQMIASALVGASPRLAALSVEDGTIGSREALASAVSSAFDGADDGDLSLLYLCTHGVISSSDDGGCYLLLGDGEQETLLGAEDLEAMLASVPGEKLLVIDACHSGALLGRTPGAISGLSGDPSIHILTSASDQESAWYYDSEALLSGAQSYFASAFASGLGLYESPEADANGDGQVSLAEKHRYLTIAVPSASAQLLSRNADSLILPSASRPMLSRPLTGFSYGASLILTDDPVFEFSFTAERETAVQYRLVEYTAGGWDWAGAQIFLDGGDGGSGLITPGRKHRALTLDAVAANDSGYLMLQVFSLTEGRLQLCSERLIAVQPAQCGAGLTLQAIAQPLPTGEILLCVDTPVPAEITVSIRDGEGHLIRRLCASSLTRPSADGQTKLYWDGLDSAGHPIDPAAHPGLTATAEAIIGGERRKAVCPIALSPQAPAPQEGV